jgi:hypothetical protein
MASYVVHSDHSLWEIGFSWARRAGKQILNALSERAAVAAERSQFAGLPDRYLDDIGMTPAERVSILGYEEPTRDGWRLVASHL